MLSNRELSFTLFPFWLCLGSPAHPLPFYTSSEKSLHLVGTVVRGWGKDFSVFACVPRAASYSRRCYTLMCFSSASVFLKFQHTRNPFPASQPTFPAALLSGHSETCLGHLTSPYALSLTLPAPHQVIPADHVSVAVLRGLHPVTKWHHEGSIGPWRGQEVGTVAFRAFEKRNLEEKVATNQSYRTEKTVQELSVEASSHCPEWECGDPTLEHLPFSLESWLRSPRDI